MAVTFQIFPKRGLVYVHYEGFAKLDDSFAAFAQYTAHPDCRPGQKQLVDLSGITGMETDYAKLFALQAKKAETFMASEAQTLIVYYAPNDLTFDMAKLILRSWEPSGAVIASVQRTEAEALNILGQRETSFADLLQSA